MRKGRGLTRPFEPMAYTIKNISKAPRGIHTSDGIVWIKPGKVKTLETDAIASIRARKAVFEVAEGGGDVPKIPRDLAAKVTKAKAVPKTRRTTRKRTTKATK